MQALPHMLRYDDAIVVVKYGGHAMGDDKVARDFARDSDTVGGSRADRDYRISRHVNPFQDDHSNGETPSFFSVKARAAATTWSIL
jgi:hypothetical protein